MCKFWLKIPNRLGKNVGKPRGGDFFDSLTHTVSDLIKRIDEISGQKQDIVKSSDRSSAKKTDDRYQGQGCPAHVEFRLD